MKYGNYEGFNKGGDYGCYYSTKEEWREVRKYKNWKFLHRYYEEGADGPWEHTTYKLYHPDKHCVSYRLGREAREEIGYTPELHANVIYETETRYEVMVAAVESSKTYDFLVKHGFIEMNF